MELAGLSLGSQYDQLDFTGNILLLGSIEVALLNGFLPHVGDHLDMFRYGGSFDVSVATFRFVNALSGLQFSQFASDGVFSLSVTALPEPSSYALASIGLVAAVLFARRRVARASLSSRLSGERY